MDTNMNQIDVTFDDTEFLREQEGYRSKAYPDPVTKGKPYTIAWGLTGDWVTKDLVLDEQTAKIKFMERIDIFTQDINKLLKVQLNKNQYLAVLSFTYNIGSHNLEVSTFLTEVNNSNFQNAADSLLQWTHAGGKNILALKARRERERALLLKPC